MLQFCQITAWMDSHTSLMSTFFKVSQLLEAGSASLVLNFWNRGSLKGMNLYPHDSPPAAPAPLGNEIQIFLWQDNHPWKYIHSPLMSSQDISDSLSIQVDTSFDSCMFEKIKKRFYELSEVKAILRILDIEHKFLYHCRTCCSICKDINREDCITTRPDKIIHYCWVKGSHTR